MTNPGSGTRAQERWKDIGVLIVRVGIGFSMMTFHGYGKLIGGPERWESLGSQTQNLGVDFLPVFWGFMAMFSEFFCSILLIVGVLFRPATVLLAATMFVAAVRHLSLPAGTEGAGFPGASHALELLTIYAALFFTGPGRYSVAALWSKKS
jgi:putative oxidoreductase